MTGRGRAVPDTPTIAALGLSLVLWASAFAGIRVALTGYSPGGLTLSRLLVGSATLGIYARERLGPSALLGIVLGLAGAATIALGSGKEGLRLSFGALVILLAALAESIYFVVQKSLLRSYGGAEVGMYTLRSYQLRRPHQHRRGLRALAVGRGNVDRVAPDGRRP